MDGRTSKSVLVVVAHVVLAVCEPCATTDAAVSTCTLTAAQRQQQCACQYEWVVGCGRPVGTALHCEAANDRPATQPPSLPPPQLFCAQEVCADCYTPATPAVVGSGPLTRNASSCPSGGLRPTSFDFQGPFWLDGAPVRNNLLAPGDGPELLLDISVVDTDCQPISNAKVDLWHTSAAGYYWSEEMAQTGDESLRYKYAGILYSDAAGRARLRTVVPSAPPSRPICHIHVRYNRPGSSSVYVTQIYFPGAAGNDPSQSAGGVIDELAHILSADTSQNIHATYQFVVPKEA